MTAIRRVVGHKVHPYTFNPGALDHVGADLVSAQDRRLTPTAGGHKVHPGATANMS